MGFLNKYEPCIYPAMRFVVGFLFFFHGAQKLLGWFGGAGSMPPHIMYVAGTIELVGGIMVALGLYTSIAAFLASGLMAVAYFTAHQPHAAFPIGNKGELAALYSWIFLYIASRGDGMFSLGALLKKKR